jgi:hypothetical protein
VSRKGYTPEKVIGMLRQAEVELWPSAIACGLSCRLISILGIFALLAMIFRQ